MFKIFVTVLFATICGLLIFSKIESMILPKFRSSADHMILTKENILERSPIGDNLNAEVYSFIKLALLESRPWQLINIQKLRDNEIKHRNDKDYKPFSAEIFEGELSSLLRILKNASKCEYITLYQKDGVGVATSGPLNSPNYSVLMSPRNIDFEIGILSQNTLNEP